MGKQAQVVTTALGDLEGLWSDGVATFRNVPYAGAPTGARRFAPPVPPEAWTGIRPAREHGPIAPQRPSRLRAAVGNFTRPQSEDCLSLTIWTPAPGPAHGRPVLVWLHGGAYMSGAGSLDSYDGAALAREGDIVVVGVNYRLGVCGFFHRPDLNEPNPALRDQQAALKWVAAHIEAFGGDPGAVTVMGQSAGGGAIAFHLTQPDTRRLFHRAILQSAALYPPLTAAESGQRADRICELVGIDAGDIGGLRAVPIERLLEAQATLAREVANADPLALPFCPVGADAVSPQAYLGAIADGAAGKEVLIGWTREEMHAFYAADPAMQELDDAALATRSEFIAGDPAAIDPYRARRPGGSRLDILADFVTDRRFARPAQQLAETIAKRNGKVWTYRFDWAGPQSKFKACHCIELPFLFETTGLGAPMLAGGNPADMAALGTTLRKSWIGFVRDGDPGHRGLPRWDAHSGDRASTLGFGREPRVIA